MKPASTRRTIYYHSRAILRALTAVWRDWLHRNIVDTDPDERRQLAQRVARTIPKPRLIESQYGVYITASCEAEAAEILYLRYCQLEKVT